MIKRADYIFTSVMVAVVVFFIVLSMNSGKPATPMPIDADHQIAHNRADCLVCHAPENKTAKKPISQTHPFKWKDTEYRCTNCHNSFR